MVWRPPRAKRTDTLFPYTTLFRSYGQTGPRAAEGGFDLTMQAAAGVMSVTDDENGAPVKCGVPLSDFVSGLYGAYAIAAQLARVRAGGSGGRRRARMTT